MCPGMVCVHSEGEALQEWAPCSLKVQKQPGLRTEGECWGRDDAALYCHACGSLLATAPRLCRTVAPILTTPLAPCPSLCRLRDPISLDANYKLLPACYHPHKYSPSWTQCNMVTPEGEEKGMRPNFCLAQGQGLFFSTDNSRLSLLMVGIRCKKIKRTIQFIKSPPFSPLPSSSSHLVTVPPQYQLPAPKCQLEIWKPLWIRSSSLPPNSVHPNFSHTPWYLPLAAHLPLFRPCHFTARPLPSQGFLRLGLRLTCLTCKARAWPG